MEVSWKLATYPQKSSIFLLIFSMKFKHKYKPSLASFEGSPFFVESPIFTTTLHPTCPWIGKLTAGKPSMGHHGTNISGCFRCSDFPTKTHQGVKGREKSKIGWSQPLGAAPRADHLNGCGGVLKWRDTPNAVWIISWKIRNQNGWELGVALF